MPSADRRRAGRQRLGRLLDLHQAHAAVGRDRELLVIAEVRDVDAEPVRGLHHHGAGRHLDRPAVDLDLGHVALMPLLAQQPRAAGLSRPGSACGSMWCSNSSRKCWMKLFTGSAAASPSAQIVRPAMLSATLVSTSRSSCRPRAGLDAVHHAVQPAGALAARRALAARLLEVEVRQALEAAHHAARCRP